jgi:hypothetical protein
MVTTEKLEPESVLRSSVVVLAHGIAIIEPSPLMANPVTSPPGVALINVGEYPQLPKYLRSFVVQVVPPFVEI